MANENTKELPMWKRIKQGEKLPCQSFLRKYDGEILRLTTTGGVTVGQDCFYLPVENVIEEIRKFPIEESEDERIINNIRKVIGWYRGMFTEKSLMPEQYQEIDAWLEKQGEQKSIRDVEISFSAKDSELEEVSYNIPKGYHAEIENNNVVIKKGEQKPAEWSEEDESHIRYLIECLEHCKKGVSLTMARPTAQEYIDWLKSLRPQPTWKPSKKQMNTLMDAIVYVEGCNSNFKGSGSVLESLYNDLEKLRDE